MSLLRQFIFESLMEGTLLLEGVLDQIKEKSNREDKEWDEAHEYLSRDIPQAKLKQYLLWLQKIAQKTQEPLRDIVPLLPSFHKRKEMKHLKGRDADINSYKNVADLQAKLEEISDVHIDYEGEMNKIRTKSSADADIVYESDNFIVYFPKTEKGSIVLGKGTSWCTARTDGDNMFADYAVQNIFLFYVFKKQNDEKWSIGLEDGKINSYIQDGGSTVNKDNQAFKKQSQIAIFGSEYYKIIPAIKKHSTKYRQHPYRKKVKDLFLNDDSNNKLDDKKFMHLLYAFNQNELSENDKQAIKERVWKIIKKDERYTMQSFLRLLDHIDDEQILYIIKNTQYPLIQKDIKEKLSKSKNTSVKILDYLASELHYDKAIYNPKTSLKVVEKILKTSKNKRVVTSATLGMIKRPDVTKEILRYIISNQQNEVIITRAKEKLENLVNSN